MSDDNGQDQGWTPARIRALRDRLGLTQSEFGERLGIQGRQVRRLERGSLEPFAEGRARGRACRPTGSAVKLLEALEREAEARDRRRGG